MSAIDKAAELEYGLLGEATPVGPDLPFEKDIEAMIKAAFYKGFEKCKKDDANCFTAWREEAANLLISVKSYTHAAPPSVDTKVEK